MAQRLISSVYLRGDESRAHYKCWSNPTVNGVPKNIRKAGKVVPVNKHLYAFERSGADVPMDALLLLLK